MSYDGYPEQWGNYGSPPPETYRFIGPGGGAYEVTPRDTFITTPAGERLYDFTLPEGEQIPCRNGTDRWRACDHWCNTGYYSKMSGTVVCPTCAAEETRL